MSAEEEKAALLGVFTEGKRITYSKKSSSKTLHGRIVYTSHVIDPVDSEPYVNIHITPIVKGHEGEPFVIKSSEIEQYDLQIARSRRRSIGGRRMSKTQRQTRAMNPEEAEKAKILGRFAEGKRITYRTRRGVGGKTRHGRIEQTSPVMRPVGSKPYVSMAIAPIIKGHRRDLFMMSSSDIQYRNLKLHHEKKLKSKTRRRRRV
jgi:hypothetical protein